MELVFAEFGATEDILKFRHKYLSGCYLVTRVRHMYKQDVGFYTYLTLQRNALTEKIESLMSGSIPA